MIWLVEKMGEGHIISNIAYSDSWIGMVHHRNSMYKIEFFWPRGWTGFVRKLETNSSQCQSLSWREGSPASKIHWGVLRSDALLSRYGMFHELQILPAIFTKHISKLWWIRPSYGCHDAIVGSYSPTDGERYISSQLFRRLNSRHYRILLGSECFLTWNTSWKEWFIFLTPTCYLNISCAPS